MDWVQFGAVGGLIVVSLGLVEVVKAVVRRRAEANGNGAGVVSKLDCLKTQNALKEAIEAKLDVFRKDLKDALDRQIAAIEKHEAKYHSEVSGVHRVIKEIAP